MNKTNTHDLFYQGHVWPHEREREEESVWAPMCQFFRVFRIFVPKFDTALFMRKAEVDDKPAPSALTAYKTNF